MLFLYYFVSLLSSSSGPSLLRFARNDVSPAGGGAGTAGVEYGRYT
jgi:hypothetical protein